MDELLAGLSKQQAMLLLTAVAFGGQGSLQALEHLPEEEELLLKERARAILQIPRERRVPYLVQGIKRLVASQRTDWFQGTSAAHVAAALQGERASVVEVLLRALPAEIARDARLALRRAPVRLSRDLRPALLAAIRWRFEEKLARTPAPPALTLADLARLSAPELASLCDALGARCLAAALAIAGGAERAGCLARLSPEQREAVERAELSGPRTERAVARRWLDQVLAARDAERAVREMGLGRLASACLSTLASLAGEVEGALDNDLRRALGSLVDKERARPQGDGDTCRREVLSELQALAARRAVEAGAESRAADASAGGLHPPATAQGSQLAPGPRRPKP